MWSKAYKLSEIRTILKRKDEMGIHSFTWPDTVRKKSYLFFDIQIRVAVTMYEKQ